MGPGFLIIAAVAATVAIVLGALDHRTASVATRVAVVAAWAAVLVLVAALIRVDTSLELVVSHTRPGLSAPRRVMGLWGGSEGSLLFFAAVLGTALASVAPTSRAGRIAAPLAIAPLLWATVTVASPFERLDVPAIAGSGLSPILEHWAMLIHPPLLYGGLALALVPALMDAGPRSARVSRLAVAVLTAALALGGRWAYTELGWGGWWAWDPVENAALIPWFLLIVHLHVPPHHTLHRWAALLVWPAVFAGSAMTRTSLRTSVHAFANADDIGWFLWPLTAAVAVGSALVGSRLPRSTRLSVPRLLPVTIAFFCAIVVALGTYRPFLPGEATDGTFFARYLWPVAIVAIVGLGLAPAMRGRNRTDGSRPMLFAAIGAILGLTLAMAVGLTIWWQIVHAAALGAGLATLPFARSRRQHLAHLGLWLVLAGALGGTASTQQTFSLDQGEARAVEGHLIENVDLSLEGDNPAVITATVVVDGHRELRPSLAIHPERALRLPEVATTGHLFEDLQLILRSADDDGSILLTVNVEPLANWVWIGAALITAAMFVPGRVSTRKRAATTAAV